MGRHSLVVAICGLLLIGGVFDQAGRGLVPDYAALEAEYGSDHDFVARIEQRLERNAMVFQFPYYPFPEFLGSTPLGNYQLFRPYLHSHGLRWSHGAMKGRFEDLWQRALATFPVDEQVHALEGRGFRGIAIDRNGYADRAASLEAALTSLIGPPSVVSADGHLSFFTLSGARLDRP